MFKLTQPRTLALAGAALPTHGIDNQPVLVPVQLAGTEAIGILFEYALTCRTSEALEFSPSVTANIDLDKLVGTEVTVSIQIEGKGTFVPGLPGNSGAGNIGAGTREITGVVSAARLVREEARAFIYEFTLRPWPWLATQGSDRRLFQDMNVVEITDAVMSKYPFPIDKRLSGPSPRTPYPKRELQRQHDESDWTFLQRLWEEWGIAYCFEHDGGHCRLVLTDTSAAFQPHGEAYTTIRYEPPGGRRIDEEHISELSVTNVLTAGRVTGVDYDYTQSKANLGVRAEDPRNTAHADQEVYVWGDHAQPRAGASGLAGEPNNVQDEAYHLARVRMEALRCQGLRAKGKGNLRGVTAGQTFRLAHHPQTAANREYLVVSSTLDIKEVAETSGSGGPFHCEASFELQPANAPFRLLRTVDKPRLDGPENAIVTGPAGQEIWTDAYGRVKLQFIWDRQGKRDEQSSCWVRVASSWQGGELGAQHVPRIGQNVLVSHINGDLDLPVVTGLAVNDFNQPAWELPGNHALSGGRSREIGGRASSHLAFDDTKGELQAQLATDQGTSLLGLGFIRRIFGNKGRQDARGKGFELRTDFWGVVRAAWGLLITTEARPNAEGHSKDMGETVARLTQARDLHESLSELAQQHGAQQPDADQRKVTRTIKAQNAAIRGTTTDDNPFPELSEPHLTLASPAGIQTTTAGSTHIASEKDLAMTTGGHVGMAVGRSLFASVREAVSIFAYKAGMSLIAASGKVKIQAQQDGIELIAQKVIELISTTDRIRLAAAKTIELQVNGTTLELGPEGFKVLTQGQCYLYAGDHQTFGPQAKPVKFPVFNRAADTRTLTRAYHDEEPVQGGRFDIEYDDGQHFGGVLNAAGHADLTLAPNGNGRVRFGPDARAWQAKAADGSPTHRPTWSEGDFAASAHKNTNGAA